MDNSSMCAYRILGAVRFIRSHGIDAWSTDDLNKVLAMDSTVDPKGIFRSTPVIIPARRATIMRWLGY